MLLPNVLAFLLSYGEQYLKKHISYQYADQIIAAACIKKRLDHDQNGHGDQTRHRQFAHERENVGFQSVEYGLAVGLEVKEVRGYAPGGRISRRRADEDASVAPRDHRIFVEAEGLDPVPEAVGHAPELASGGEACRGKALR